MQIYSALQRGDFHLNHCEDYLYIDHIDSNTLLCAVMDGCTMGKDSYFVATLTGKLLRKICKTTGYTEFLKGHPIAEPEERLKAILKELFQQLNQAKNTLMLEEKELLTTLIISLTDIRDKKGLVLVVGDGVVSVNGQLTEFDQDNRPDYLGFHLATPFEEWYKAQHQKITFSNLRDLTIATDGITLFQPTTSQASTINPAIFLTTGSTFEEKEDKLNLLLKQLEHEHHLIPGDDLAIIRITL